MPSGADSGSSRLASRDSTGVPIDVNLDASLCGQKLDPPGHPSILLFSFASTTVPPMLVRATLTASSIETEHASTSAAVFLAWMSRSKFGFIPSPLRGRLC